MNYIFLDIDGVLNNENTRTTTFGGFTFVDEVLVERLSRLVKETNARVVLSSTWRMGWIEPNPFDMNNKGYFIDLVNVLLNHDIMLYNATPILHKMRGHEIMEYIDSDKDVTNFVILDDDDDMYKLRDHLVQTDWRVGLTEDDCVAAAAMLKE